MDDRLRLAELLTARLCHDLSGLLGGVHGTLDLLLEELGANETAAIAHETATALTRRMKLLRTAWGGPPEPLDLPQFTALALGLANRRVVLDVSALSPKTAFSPVMGRLLANLLVLGADSLPRGGTVALDGDATDIIIRLSGPDAAWPIGFAAMLVDEPTAWAALHDARSLQGPLTALLAHHSGLRLTLLHATGATTAAPPLRLCQT